MTIDVQDPKAFAEWCKFIGAIPKADYENRLKADMVAMLEDLRLRADETQGHKYNSDFWEGFYTYDDIIRAEINALKENTDE